MKSNQHLPGTLAAITLATLGGTAAAQDPFGADPAPAAPVDELWAVSVRAFGQCAASDFRVFR